MRLVFLCRLLPYVSPTVQCRHKLVDALVYSLTSTPFHWCSGTLGAAVVGSLVSSLTLFSIRTM